MLNRFNSNSRKLNRSIPIKVNLNNIANLDTGSLENIQAPTTRFNSNTKSNPNPIKIVNNKNTINNFYQEILEHSVKSNIRAVDSFDNTANTLTIYNVATDYGTEGASPDNFEILVYGLHIAGNYKITEVGNDVVITLGDRYIDFDNVTLNDIYVIGKLVDVPMETEDGYNIQTENDLDLFI